MREGVANFATGQLTNSMGTGDSSFSLSTGQGSAFPHPLSIPPGVGGFVVTIDNECLLVPTRSGDSFGSVSQPLVRGYDGTVATTHTAGTTVQLSMVREHFTHLWQNVPDTYVPQVPPFHWGASTQGNDCEFESLYTNWTLYPATSPGSASIWGANSPIPSHLLLARSWGSLGGGDNTTYWAYAPLGTFGGGGGTVYPTVLSVTTKLSASLDFSQTVAGDSATSELFVADSNPPTNSLTSGSRIRLVLTTTNLSTNGQIASNARVLQAYSVANSVSSPVGLSVPVPVGAPLYLRLTRANTTAWYAMFSLDGVIYTLLATLTSAFTMTTTGLAFSVSNPSGQFVYSHAAVDYVRVIATTNNVLPLGPYGTPGY